jgi:predicted esterase
MGCIESLVSRNDNASIGSDNSPTERHELIPSNNKYKFLCLHGFRTSGKILEFQSASFRILTNLDCKCLDAPYPALGEPNEDIKMIYAPPSFNYYEWINASTDSDLPTRTQQLENDILLVVNELKKSRYDGILGFSQGACIVTEVLKHLENNNLSSLVKCAILIGGVTPSYYVDTITTPFTVSLPNLHIIGDMDEYKASSLELTKWYNAEKQIVLTHTEGHRIPSMNTGLYPKVLDWLKFVVPK